MRMARERSHSGNVHGRPGSRALLLGGVAFALALAGIVSVTLANHATTTWDFGTSSDYTYDPNKILVEGGVAHLRKSFTVTHSTQADFNGRDRKSTRLNSSHSQISYAVFCLKKKKYTSTFSFWPGARPALGPVGRSRFATFSSQHRSAA